MAKKDKAKQGNTPMPKKGGLTTTHIKESLTTGHIKRGLEKPKTSGPKPEDSSKTKGGKD